MVNIKETHQSAADSHMSRERETVKVDLVVIGGGPAGLSAGIYAERSGMTTIIVDKGSLGGQVLDTTVVENYPGMKKVSGATLAEIMASHALDYVTIYENEAVQEVVPGQPFRVETSKRIIEARAVIIATGAKRRQLGLTEESQFWGKGLSYSPTKDGHLYAGQKAFIIGGGDSAATEALFLKEAGVDITLVHRSGKLDAQRALVRQLDAASIPIRFHAEIKKIHGKNSIEHVELVDTKTGKASLEAVKALFISIGYVPAIELAEKLGLKLTAGHYIEHTSCRTNIPGLYVAGDIAGGFKQIVTASSQGAEAALTAFNDLNTELSPD